MNTILHNIVCVCVLERCNQRYGIRWETCTLSSGSRQPVWQEWKWWHPRQEGSSETGWVCAKGTGRVWLLRSHLPKQNTPRIRSDLSLHTCTLSFTFLFKCFSGSEFLFSPHPSFLAKPRPFHQRCVGVVWVKRNCSIAKCMLVVVKKQADCLTTSSHLLPNELRVTFIYLFLNRKQHKH